jgi:O-antigen ligase
VVGSAHSSFIEIIAELGVAGAALYAAFVLGLIRRNLCLAPGAQKRIAFFVILAYLTAGFSESIAGLDVGLPLLALLVTALPVPRRAMAQHDAVPARDLPAPAISR